LDFVLGSTLCAPCSMLLFVREMGLYLLYALRVSLVIGFSLRAPGSQLSAVL